MPHGKKPIGCKWVYKVKFNANRIVERYKGGLIAKGFTKWEGLGIVPKNEITITHFRDVKLDGILSNLSYFPCFVIAQDIRTKPGKII